MSSTHIADLTARLGASAIPAAGFGVPLLAGYTTVFPGRTRRYSGDPGSILQAMLDDGFLTGEAMYRMASKLLGQEFAPREIVLGRLALAHTQTVVVTPKNLTEGSVYTLTIKSALGSETFTYTVDTGGETAAEIATALHALIDAAATVTDVASVDGTGFITLDAATAGDTFAIDWTVNGKSRPADLDFLDTTTDPGVATDLAAIKADDDTWYALMLDVESPAIADAAQTWIAAEKKVYFAQSSDSDATEVGTSTDIGSVALGDTNNRCAPVWEPNYRQYTGCALAGSMLPRQPGSATWANKRLRGVTAADLTPALFNALKAKRYTTLRALNASLSATTDGQVAGEYLYIDILRSFDYVEAAGEAALVTLNLSNGKVPFTAVGLALVRQALERVVKDCVSLGILSAGDPDNAEEDPLPLVILPAIGDPGANLAARTARELSEFKITGRFQGAIHSYIGEVVIGF
jgi:hypothetical protein